MSPKPIAPVVAATASPTASRERGVASSTPIVDPAAAPTPPRGRGQRRCATPSTYRVTFRLEKNEYANLTKAAAVRSVASGQICREALAQYIPDMAQTPRVVERIVERPAAVDVAMVTALSQLGGTLRQALGLGRGDPLEAAQLRRLIEETIKATRRIG